jgi:MFS family permease
MLLLSPAGGAAADRFPRRTLVFATQSVFLAQAALLAWLTATARAEVWILFLLGAIYGVANAFDIPARQAMLLDMTGPEELISAISLNSMLFNLARIAGPAIAGFALASVGEAWCFGLNAASFLAVLVGLGWMRFERATLSEHSATWRETLGYLRRHPSALHLLLLCAALNIGFSGVFVLNPFFADGVFGQGPRGLGFLTASMGLGAVVGTYLLAQETNQERLPRVILISGMTIGAAFLAYAASPSFSISLALMALAGGSLMRQNAATNSLLQTSAPSAMRGRIISLFGMAVVGMAPIGAALAGAVARQTSPRAAAAGSAFWCLTFSALAALRLRRAAFLLLLVIPAGAADQKLLRQVRALLRETSSITGLAVKREVPAAMLTRAELERYLAKKMKEDVDPDAIATEELVIKRLGFAPDDFNLKETTLALLSEQAAAFYDFEKRKLYVVQSASESMVPELLIHELGHALQDQHFGLRRFLKAAGEDDDGALARMAVMEGQAMWLMARYAQRSVESVKPDEGAEADYPVLAKVPLYLKESLLFPYEEGLRFHAAVCQRYDDCVTRVFREPPASSAQILHPDLYFRGVKPERVVLPPAPAPAKWKERAAGNLGEFDFDLLLRTHRIQAPGVARNWRGGGYRLLESKKSKNLLLQHASVWEDEDSARDWFTAYRQVLAGKWRKFLIEEEADGLLRGRGDSGPGNTGRFELRRQGRSVTALEGLPLD